MAEATYYFNSRSTGNWTDPNNMIDGQLGSYASTSSNGTTETLDGNTCLGDDLGAITATEIRAYGYGDGNDKITLNGVGLTMPSSGGWSGYVNTGITTWAGLVALDATVKFTAVAKANPMHCAKVEIRVTYTIPWVPPESDIDVGADPIDRTDLWGMFYTLIDMNNPANASGILHTVKVYAVGKIIGLRVGTFYTTNGDTFKCRDSVFIGDVEAGTERTFTGLSIAVEEGDYIGCYYTAGAIECDKAGFLGLWGRYGEFIDPGDEVAYGFEGGSALSLYGYGDIGAPPPYYHGLKVQGVGELALCDVGTHPLRIRKGGVTYGLELVAVDDPNASKVRIKTPSGVKAIRRYS